MKYEKKIILRIIALILISYPLLKEIFVPITYEFVKSFTSSVYGVSTEGYLMMVEGQFLNFVPACAAIAAFYLLTILIITTKDLDFGLSVKLFAIGGLFIFIANLARIEFLIYLLVEFGKDYFEAVHLTIWRIISSIYVAAIWIFLVGFYKIKNIPIYSDIMYLLKKAKRKP